ncbi:hypothetical protein ES705_10306 [subsurface metagenome]|nr:hypothetical protein [Clostridia bacterium]
MATIKDTLIEIEKFQKEMEGLLKIGKVKQNKFAEDIMNFTTIYYFELLSHASLELLKNKSLLPTDQMFKRYFSLFRQKMVLQEYIRWQNIGGLFMVWNIFEKIIRKLHKSIPNTSEKSLEDSYKDILKYSGFDSKQYSKILEEFNAMRLTRNSLHQGGVYKFPQIRKYTLAGEIYTFEQGKEVRPIRLMTAINVMWSHYLYIIQSNKFCS